MGQDTVQDSGQGHGPRTWAKDMVQDSGQGHEGRNNQEKKTKEKTTDNEKTPANEAQ